MKVLLRQDFPTLGEAGKVVSVKDGLSHPSPKAATSPAA